MTFILDGKKVSQIIKNNLKNRITNLKRKPGLGIILVGDRPDSKIYVKIKKKNCNLIGIKNFDVKLPENITKEKLIYEIKKMNDNNEIDGILVQLPLPKHLNQIEILSNISIHKDVDGFHTTNMGYLVQNNIENSSVPCTPIGCLKLLDYYNIKIKGKDVVVIGKSQIVGLPLALLLLHREATVTICHSNTKNITDYTKKADILLVACGVPHLIKEQDIKKDVIIIDIGINKIIDIKNKRGYRIVGDVDYEGVFNKVKAITPVPGGIGPMTIAQLLTKTVELSMKNKKN